MSNNHTINKVISVLLSFSIVFSVFVFCTIDVNAYSSATYSEVSKIGVTSPTFSTTLGQYRINLYKNCSYVKQSGLIKAKGYKSYPTEYGAKINSMSYRLTKDSSLTSSKWYIVIDKISFQMGEAGCYFDPNLGRTMGINTYGSLGKTLVGSKTAPSNWAYMSLNGYDVHYWAAQAMDITSVGVCLSITFHFQNKSIDNYKTHYADILNDVTEQSKDVN